ncbi:transketolase (plasmid) [Vibrio nigripulchritudo]|uniref:transketolase family protein n=1 Tax=Vibrio nigripulchritudo TaxID=28173 RepID=UPI00190A2F8B|nr:transketolase C-terminal domain-containing protein [Vibrio nigripulchritudo]BCL73660.1 transketolase [Vibrio nigripulchritudo]BDU35029.1 transketolase [Vibrio nigripulchritudo]
MSQLLSRVHANAMLQWSKNRSDVVVLSGDLTKNTEADLFRNAYPERFFSMGLAEQNMLSVAGGMAREGLVPFVYTFAVFLYRRPFDQLQMSVAYPNLKVRLMGFLPGLSTPGGVSHQAIDDIAVMSAIPNMTVVAVGDATEVESLLPAIESVDGPVYISMMRGKVPRLFPQNEPMVLGQSRTLSSGKDILVLSSGHATEDAMRAVSALKNKGLDVGHIHVSTLKPFVDPAVLNAIAQTKIGVITHENHLIRGGLGTSVAELIAENGLSVPLKRIGLRDTYAHGGSHNYLKKHYAIDSMALIRKVEAMLGVDTGITESDLDDVRVEVEHGAHKPEAL